MYRFYEIKDDFDYIKKNPLSHDFKLIENQNVTSNQFYTDFVECTLSVIIL